MDYRKKTILTFAKQFAVVVLYSHLHVTDEFPIAHQIASTT